MITTEIARTHLGAWLEAELAVTTHQSYKIGTRSLTRADLSEIRKQIDYWQKQLARLERSKTKRARNRIYRAVPRDL